MGGFLVGSSSVSRVLSWMIIYLVRTLPYDSSGYRPADGPPFMQISLQQTGFTSSVRHRTLLWAFTPLVSPFPFLRGSFVSVALSLGSPPVAVSDCHRPMLPGLSSRTRKGTGDHLTSYLTSIIRYLPCI